MVYCIGQDSEQQLVTSPLVLRVVQKSLNRSLRQLQRRWWVMTQFYVESACNVGGVVATWERRNRSNRMPAGASMQQLMYTWYSVFEQMTLLAAMNSCVTLTGKSRKQNTACRLTPAAWCFVAVAANSCDCFLWKPDCLLVANQVLPSTCGGRWFLVKLGVVASHQ